MIALQAAGPQVDQLLHELAQMGTPTLWEHALQRSAIVGEQPDAVARIQRNLCQAQRGIDRIVQLGETADARLH